MYLNEKSCVQMMDIRQMSYKGYIYFFHKKLVNGIKRWRCVKISGKNRCTAFIKTEGPENKVIFERLNHNHGSRCIIVGKEEKDNVSFEIESAKMVSDMNNRLCNEEEEDYSAECASFTSDQIVGLVKDATGNIQSHMKKRPKNDNFPGKELSSSEDDDGCRLAEAMKTRLALNFWIGSCENANKLVDRLYILLNPLYCRDDVDREEIFLIENELRFREYIY